MPRHVASSLQVGGDGPASIDGRSARVLLVRHAGCYNRGCEAILRCTSQLLREYLPGSRIVVSVHDIEEDRKYLSSCEPDLRLVPTHPAVPQRYTWGWLGAVVNRRLRYHRVVDTVYANKDEYEGADVVLQIGGDNLIPTSNVAWSYLRELAFAKQLGAKTGVWACSISPCREAETARFAAALHKIDLITVRESATVEYLRDIGVTKNVVRVADPAFLLTAEATELSARVAGGGECVGLGISALLANKYSGYLQANIGFARWLLANEESSLLLVPHVIGRDEKSNDLASCRAVYGALGDSSRVSMTQANMSAAQVKGAISACRYFIGARMHSTIASLSSFVPTISIGYSIKAIGLNRDLLGTEEFLLDAKTVSDSGLIKVFRRLQGKADSIRAQLQKSVPHSQELARKNGAAIAELLRDACSVECSP